MSFDSFDPTEVRRSQDRRTDRDRYFHKDLLRFIEYNIKFDSNSWLTEEIKELNFLNKCYEQNRGNKYFIKKTDKSLKLANTNFELLLDRLLEIITYPDHRAEENFAECFSICSKIMSLFNDLVNLRSFLDTRLTRSNYPVTDLENTIFNSIQNLRVFCRECNTNAANGNKFCSSCGNNLIKVKKEYNNINQE